MSYNDDGRAFEREQEREQGMKTMHSIMKAVIDENGNVFPYIAIPSLLYVAGYLIAKSLREDNEPPDIDAVLQNCINDIAYAMSTSAVFEITANVINKAKGEGR
jgi:hydroxymethylpyrimidine pyrophosphatase-like HAD family hydrolase